MIPFLDIGMKLIDKLIPDPAAKAAHQLELLKLQQAGEFKELEADLQVNLQQIEVNKIEAQSDNLFKSGWRPAVGWICVVALLYEFLLRPLIGWFALIKGHPVPVALEMGDLLTLLLGMLGLGAMRSHDKVKGVA